MDYLSNNISKLDKILKIRGEEWPKRGEVWHTYNAEITKFYLHLINNPNFRVNNIDKNIVSKLSKIEDRPIFICGNEKSGTTLLTQLLDNHKNIFSLPGDSHYVNNFYDSKKHNINKLGNFWLSRIINPTGQEPFFPYGRSEEIYQNFINYLHYFIETEKKNTFKSIVLSLIAATKTDNLENLKYWCEKTPLNELKIKKIKASFPDAKFINILRNPVRNIISLNRLDKFRNRKTNILKRTLFQVFLEKQTAINQEQIENYHVINYKDLISETKSQTKNICDFLHIDFSETLLKPSINGLPATANSMYKNGRTKGEIVTDINQSDKLKELSDKEKKIIVNILSVHKTYKSTLFFDYPALKPYKNKFYILIAKFTFFLYKTYRTCFK